MRAKKTTTACEKTLSLRSPQKLLMILFMTSLLSLPGAAASFSTMDGAIATMIDRASWSESEANQIGGSYKAYVLTKATGVAGDFSKWYRMELPKSKTIVEAFVNQDCTTVYKQQRMGTSYICATDTDAVPVLDTDCIPFPNPSGGWISGFSLTGKYFWLYRDGPGDSDDHFYIHEWAIYEVPNQTRHAETLYNYTATDTDHEKENLVNHLDNQCMRSTENPLQDLDGTQAPYNSCYQVEVSEIPPGEPFVFGLKHLLELFQHTVVLVQDLLTEYLDNDDPADYQKYLAANWEVRIGNSENWRENPICPGGLKLKSTFEDVKSDSSLVGKWVPAFGFSSECNMPGMYTYFIAYILPSESVTLCNTAVIGTPFIRDEPLADNIEVYSGSTATFSVPHVHAVDTIGNIQGINLHLSEDSELTSVQFINRATATEVTIDATGLTMGTYTLKLESFGYHDGDFLVLKTDTITIDVVLNLPAFADFLDFQTIVSGEESVWSLPPLKEGQEELSGLVVKFDRLIAGYVSFDEESLTFRYIGLPIKGLLEQEMVHISITLVNSFGSNFFTQLVNVVPSPNTLVAGQDDIAEPSKTKSVAQGSQAAQTGETSSILTEALAELEKQEKKREQDEGSAYVSPNAPKITIREITDSGRVVFAFSEDMQVIPDDDLVLLKSTNVTDSSGVTRPLFNITVRPDDAEFGEYPQFTWQPIKMTKSTLEAQLDFENPSNVSMSKKPDSLEVQINGQKMLFSKRGQPLELPRTHDSVIEQFEEEQQRRFDRYTLISMKVPKQLPKGPGHEIAMNVLSVVAEGTKIAIIVNVLVNFLISGSLNELWSAINSQQIIILITLIDVPLPANTLAFLEGIYSIASFEIYPGLGDQINSLLKLLPTEPMTQGLADLGFESGYVLNNMGTMVFFYLGYLILVLVQKALKKCSRCSTRVAKASRSLQKYLYYNSFITGLVEGYSVLALSVQIGFYNLNWDTFGSSLQSVFCICFAVMIIVVPVLLMKTTIANFDRLGEFEMQKRFGSFYSSLRLASGISVLLQPAFFLLRRLIVPFAIVVGRNTIILQIYLIWAQSTVASMIIGFVNPFGTVAEQRTEYFNEAVQVSMLFTSICLSNFGPDSKTKVYIGYFICGLLAFHLLFHTIKITLPATYRLRKTCIRKCSKKRRDNAVQAVRRQVKRENEAEREEAEIPRIQDQPQSDEESVAVERAENQRQNFVQAHQQRQEENRDLPASEVASSSGPSQSSSSSEWEQLPDSARIGSEAPKQTELIRYENKLDREMPANFTGSVMIDTTGGGISATQEPNSLNLDELDAEVTEMKNARVKKMVFGSAEAKAEYQEGIKDHGKGGLDAFWELDEAEDRGLIQVVTSKKSQSCSITVFKDK